MNAEEQMSRIGVRLVPRPACFDGNDPVDGKRNWAPSSNDRFSKVFTAICRVWDDVEFVCFGEPRYTVDAPNWRVEA